MSRFSSINNFKSDFLDSSLDLSDEELKIDKKLTFDFMKDIYKNLVANKKILIIGDYDVDGFFATVELNSYLKLLEKRVNQQLQTKVDTFYNKREYGYEIPKEMFDNFKSKYDLIVLLDTGATYSYFNENTKNVLVIDHHPNEKEKLSFVYNPNKNNKISTSTGRIVYEMIESFENNMREYFGKNVIKPHDILKVAKMYAGVTLCSDMAKMSYDNKVFLEQSLRLMSDNKKKLTFLKNIPSNNITSTDISFNLINEINGYSRMNKDLKELEKLYLYEVDSKSLLSGDSTRVQEKVLKLLKDNNDAKKNVVLNLEQSLMKKLKDSASTIKEQDVIAVNIDNDYAGLNGLLSQKVLGSHLKSNIVVSFDKKRDLYVGSGRGSSIKKALEQLVNTKPELQENVKFGGHEMAVGVSVKKEALNEFIDGLNKIKVPEQISNGFNVYSANIKEYHDAIDYYSTVSPTTLIDSKFYIELDKYKVLSNKILEKGNWYSATLLDNSGMLTVYFDEQLKNKIENNNPIFLEITNNQGTQFIKNIEITDASLALNQDVIIDEQEQYEHLNYNY